MDAPRIYLNVPSKDSSAANKLGALWDEESRGWWIDINSNRQPFNKWLPRMYRSGAVPPHITCDLVPESTWFLNLRSLLPKEQWDRIRKETYKRAGYRCQVCGGRGPKWPVECNEQWQYLPDPANPQRGIQKLLRLAALCPTCHSIKHAGLANIRGNLKQTLAHMALVNGWDETQCRKHLNEASAFAEERNEKAWSFDLSLLSDYGVDKILIDLAKTEKPLPIIGINLSYKGFTHVFNRTSGTYMCRDLAKRVSKVWAGLKWKQLPEGCPAWAAEIRTQNEQQPVIISCVTDRVIEENDFEILRTFIQTKILQNKIVVLIVRPDEKTENHMAIYENVHAVHPLYMEVRWGNDNNVSLVDGDLELSIEGFLGKLPGDFKFVGWDNTTNTCGIEFLKDKCQACEQRIYRFSGIVLPVGNVNDWSSNAWQYHTYINFLQISDDLMKQLVPKLSAPVLYNNIPRTRIGKLGKRYLVVCPHCGQEQKPDIFWGSLDDHARSGALMVDDARKDKMIYMGLNLDIDYLTMRNADGEFEISPYSCNNDSRWVWTGEN